MNGILVAAYVENIATRRDKTLKITLGTQELAPDKAGELFNLSHKLAAVYISEKEVGNNEKEMVDSVDLEFAGKTQSQRLRGVLFKLWEHNKEGFQDFKNYYHFKMDAIIEHYKTKIQ